MFYLKHILMCILISVHLAEVTPRLGVKERIVEQVDSKLSNSKYIQKRPSKRLFRLNLATWGIGNCSEWNSLQFEYQFAAQIGLVGQKNTIFYPDLSSLVLTWNLGYPLIKFGYVVARGLKIHMMTGAVVIFG